MKSALERFKDSPLAKNTAWMLGGNGLKLIIQMLYFVLIARSLEPNAYGGFVAVVAIAAIVAPFVGLGTSNLIVRNVAHDRTSFSRSWGNGILVTFVTGVIGVLLITTCSFLMPPQLHLSVLVLVAISDLLFARVVDFCTFAFAALDQFSANAYLNVGSSLSRLIALGVLILLVKHPTIDQWAKAYAAASVLTMVASLVWALSALGRPSFGLAGLWPELQDGFFFSVGQSAQNVYTDIDKTMLGKLSSLSATGIYGAAYRLIDVSLVPVRSMLSAAYPGFFRASSEGIAGSFRYMKRLLPKAMGYSAAATLGLFIFAPLVPHILGDEYKRTVEALRWLSVLPLIRAAHSFFADALTSAGYQRLRTGIQIGVALFNVLINLWLIRAYSWRGAAWSSIAADALLLALLGGVLLVLLRRERKTALGIGRTV